MCNLCSHRGPGTQKGPIVSILKVLMLLSLNLRFISKASHGVCSPNSCALSSPTIASLPGSILGLLLPDSGSPQSPGPPPRAATGFCWQEEAYLLPLPFTPVRTYVWEGLGSGTHTTVSLGGARQWLSLPHASSTTTCPASDSVGASYSLPSRGCSPLGGLPIGSMILWKGVVDVPNWGLTFSYSIGSANYVASSVQNPDQGDLKPLFPVTSHQVGDHTEECELEVRGLWPASRQKSRQEPGGSTAAPLGLCISCRGEDPPFFLPQWQLWSCLLSLPPSCSPHAQSNVLLCRSNSLHLLLRNQASGDRWGRLGGDRPQRSWKGLNAQ